ncbi:MAG TPA: type II toxin-antitoxin system RelE/ParE family toxin [Sedimentisphaerales bacterium]|nr:type II toxin-antitoxin system RelE/ParE family toxin [Sedimentisphaerales bacterium]
MSRLLAIHEAAEAEINEAADFYDLRSSGLGSAFIDEVQYAMGKIAEFPEAAPLIRNRVRKRHIARFPYSLIYSVRQDEIRILAVAHHRRRPFYWRGRD